MLRTTRRTCMNGISSVLAARGSCTFGWHASPPENWRMNNLEYWTILHRTSSETVSQYFRILDTTKHAPQHSIEHPLERRLKHFLKVGEAVFEGSVTGHFGSGTHLLRNCA